MTNEYREGDSEMTHDEPTVTKLHSVAPEPTLPPPDAQSSPAPASAPAPDANPKPFTAVLLLMFPDGRIDAVTDLPNMETDHPATMREVRSMCQSMVYDVNNIIQAKMVMNELRIEAAQRQLSSQIEGMKNRLKV